MNAPRYNYIKEFIEFVSLNLLQRSPKSIVGVLWFDKSIIHNSTLHKEANASTLLPTYIRTVSTTSGKCNIAKALGVLQSNATNASLGIKGDKSIDAIVITDAVSKNNAKLFSAALELHASRKFKNIYAVGAHNAKSSELKLIASKPQFVFHTYHSRDFLRQKENVVRKLCSGKW